MASAEAPDVVDGVDVGHAGLQCERTQLSWRRTALSFTAVGALLLHRGVESGAALDEVGGALGLAGAAATYAAGTVRYRTMVRNVRERRSVVSVVAIRAVAVLCAMLAAITLTLLIS